MKIKNIRKIETENRISLLADCKIRMIGWDTVYFTFDKKYKDFIFEDATPFASTLLVPAMYLGKNLIVEGSISKSVYDGMHKIMEVMLDWNIGMKKIKITADNIAEDNLNPQKVASFFSGGIDSFYTYLTHKNDTIDPIDYFILIRGTDINLRNKELWDATLQNTKNIAEVANVELIEVESNIQSLLESFVSPIYTHGGTLASFALCLRRGLKKVYIPASISEKEMDLPWGSHPKIDKYWSSGKTVFEHDGIAGRLEKIERQIIHSPLAMKYLRVCFMNTKDSYNCGRCEKCTHTMMGLHTAGKLKDAETFPDDFDIKKLTHFVSISGVDSCYYEEMLEVLRERNMYPDIQLAIEKGLKNLVYHNTDIKEYLFKKVLYFDHMYLRGKFYEIWIKHLRDRVRR